LRVAEPSAATTADGSFRAARVLPVDFSRTRRSSCSRKNSRGQQRRKAMSYSG
jgi:hypothetical protein